MSDVTIEIKIDFICSKVVPLPIHPICQTIFILCESIFQPFGFQNVDWWRPGLLSLPSLQSGRCFEANRRDWRWGRGRRCGGRGRPPTSRVSCQGLFRESKTESLLLRKETVCWPHSWIQICFCHFFSLFQTPEHSHSPFHFGSMARLK